MSTDIRLCQIKNDKKHLVCLPFNKDAAFNLAKSLIFIKQTLEPLKIFLTKAILLRVQHCETCLLKTSKSATKDLRRF